jgi:hypothetical protein
VGAVLQARSFQPAADSLATNGMNSMCLGSASVARLAAVYLLFTVTLLMVPKADVPETAFDECNTQTNEMIVVAAASSLEHPQPATAFVPVPFARSPKHGAPRIRRIYPGQFIDSCRIFKLCCSLLC